MSRPRSRLSLALVGACLLLAPGAARASDAGTVTKTAGAVTATVSWAADPATNGVKDPRLTISRGAAVAFDQPITDVCPEGCILLPDGPDPAQSILHVVDLDGDGEPEVVVDTFSGGAHCCTSARIYGFVAATGPAGAYKRDKTVYWGDSGYDIKGFSSRFGGEVHRWGSGIVMAAQQR